MIIFSGVKQLNSFTKNPGTREKNRKENFSKPLGALSNDVFELKNNYSVGGKNKSLSFKGGEAAKVSGQDEAYAKKLLLIIEKNKQKPPELVLGVVNSLYKIAKKNYSLNPDWQKLALDAIKYIGDIGATVPKLDEACAEKLLPIIEKKENKQEPPELVLEAVSSLYKIAEKNYSLNTDWKEFALKAIENIGDIGAKFPELGYVCAKKLIPVTEKEEYKQKYPELILEAKNSLCKIGKEFSSLNPDWQELALKSIGDIGDIGATIPKLDEACVEKLFSITNEQEDPKLELEATNSLYKIAEKNYSLNPDWQELALEAIKYIGYMGVTVSGLDIYCAENLLPIIIKKREHPELVLEAANSLYKIAEKNSKSFSSWQKLALNAINDFLNDDSCKITQSVIKTIGDIGATVPELDEACTKKLLPIIEEKENKQERPELVLEATNSLYKIAKKNYSLDPDWQKLALKFIGEIGDIGAEVPGLGYACAKKLIPVIEKEENKEQHPELVLEAANSVYTIVEKSRKLYSEPIENAKELKYPIAGENVPLVDLRKALTEMAINAIEDIGAKHPKHAESCIKKLIYFINCKDNRIKNPELALEAANSVYTIADKIDDPKEKQYLKQRAIRTIGEIATNNLSVARDAVEDLETTIEENKEKNPTLVLEAVLSIYRIAKEDDTIKKKVKDNLSIRDAVEYVSSQTKETDSETVKIAQNLLTLINKTIYDEKAHKYKKDDKNDNVNYNNGCYSKKLTKEIKN